MIYQYYLYKHIRINNMYSDESTRTVVTKTESDLDYLSREYDKRSYNNILTEYDMEDTSLIDSQMISRYDKKDMYEDDIEDGIVYYYVMKCWNPFKYCGFDNGQQQCMNITCKSIFMLLIIISVSAAIIFVFHNMMYI